MIAASCCLSQESLPASTSKKLAQLSSKSLKQRAWSQKSTRIMYIISRPTAAAEGPLSHKSRNNGGLVSIVSLSSHTRKFQKFPAVQKQRSRQFLKRWLKTDRLKLCLIGSKRFICIGSRMCATGACRGRSGSATVFQRGLRRERSKCKWIPPEKAGNRTPIRSIPGFPQAYGHFQRWVGPNKQKICKYIIRPPYLRLATTYSS